MHKQELTARTTECLVIETPVGLIRMKWSKRKRGLEITLPDALMAWVGEQRALDNAQFLRKRDDGKLEPTYSMITPAVDKSGALTGIVTARPGRPMRLAIGG